MEEKPTLTTLRRTQMVTLKWTQLTKANYVTWTPGKRFSCRLQINGNATTSPLLNIPGQLGEEILPPVVGGQAIHVRLSHCKRCDSGRKSTSPYTKFRYILCVDTVWKEKAYKACSSDYNNVTPNDIHAKSATQCVRGGGSVATPWFIGNNSLSI